MNALIIFSATYLIFVIALCAAGAVLWRHPERRLRMFWLAMVSLSLAYVFARVVGLFFSHTQPFAEEGFMPLLPHAIDNSFPSDHTLISGVFASLAYIANKRAGLVLWALVLLVGASRVAAGLHYPVDILAGAVLALCAVWVASIGLRRLGVY